MDLLHYLAKDWILGEYECWALVVEVYRRELGVELPLVNLGSTEPKAVRQAFAGASAHDLFQRLDGPQPFAVVAMGKKWLSHVGVYLETADGPRILHNRQANGVLCQPPEQVADAIPILGYYGLK